RSADTAGSISMQLQALSEHKGRAFLEIRVNKGARNNLGRPTQTPLENKLAFQKFCLDATDN
ncbi:MAG: hypothetical protein ABUL44_01520, partial [Flavobacterium sp.]